MKKGGFLLGEESVKIVFGVIVLTILLILGGKVAGIFMKDSDMEKAESNLRLLADQIEAVYGGRAEQSMVTILPPKNWFLVNYFIKVDSHPTDECIGADIKDCICFCKDYKCEGDKTCEGLGFEVYLNKIIMLDQEIEKIIIEKKEGRIVIASGSMEFSQRVLFEDFLESESDFLNMGRISFKEQIIKYIDSGYWGRDIVLRSVFKGDEEMRDKLEENIKSYFQSVPPIRVDIAESRRAEDGSSKSYIIIAGGEGTDSYPAEMILPEFKIESAKYGEVAILFRTPSS